MFKISPKYVSFNKQTSLHIKFQRNFSKSSGEVPKHADVVIIGAGSTGSNLLYQFSKKSIDAVLVDKIKINSGSTRYSCGLLWGLSANDVDIELLRASRNIYMALEAESGENPGWINNGGILISRTQDRLKEFQRLSAFGTLMGIKNNIISPKAAVKLCPILKPNSFLGALHCPEDGSVDPLKVTSALLKVATNRGGKVIENCSVLKIVTKEIFRGRKVTHVETTLGTIKTNNVINAAGVWSRNIAQMVGLDLPISIMKHSYVVTRGPPKVKNSPNIRDFDGGTYIGIKAEDVYLGGFEQNPEIIKDVPKDFKFGPLVADKSVFEVHIKSAAKITNVFDSGQTKLQICGLECFSPDMRPILGEDPRVVGLFHACGFSSAGLMLGAGCAEQLVIWVQKGRPSLPMFTYDIRRFIPEMRTNRLWITERSHESYFKTTSVTYPHAQYLSGRNLRLSPFHYGAVMYETQGWEKPEYFLKSPAAAVRPYDWYGQYGHKIDTDTKYKDYLKNNWTFDFGIFSNLVNEEAVAARKTAVLFDLSYFGKMYLSGPEARQAAHWAFTADVEKEQNKAIFSCILNRYGGIEGDVVVIPMKHGYGSLIYPIMKDQGYYIVCSGYCSYHVRCHLMKQLKTKRFRAKITDVTTRVGILAIQGPKSREIVQAITESPITDEAIPLGTSVLIKIDGHLCRLLRGSYTGEMGFLLHIPINDCKPVFEKLVIAGSSYGMQLAGFRAMYSLAIEKGYHFWGYDIRPSDNPIEANLAKACRRTGTYEGKNVVDDAIRNGCKKLRAFFVINEKVPLIGQEVIWKDGVMVGFLRRGEYGYEMKSSIGIGYISNKDGKVVKQDSLKSGKFEIQVFDKKYPAKAYLTGPFDPKGLRLLGTDDN